MAPRLVTSVGVGAVLLVTAACAASTSSIAPTTSQTPAATSSATPNPIISGKDKVPPGYTTISFDGPRYIDGKPAIYLTFDDGPEPGSTNLVLSALAKKNTPATFFVLGSLIGSTSSASLIKQEFEQGNSVSIHGWIHNDMTLSTRPAIRMDLLRTKSRIEKLTGQAPTCFRPPYGSYNGNVSWEAFHAGLRIQRWTGDTKDWEFPNPDTIMKAIDRNWRPGYVILLHDGANHGAVSAAVVPRIVAEAAKRGYVIGGNLCPMVAVPTA